MLAKRYRAAAVAVFAQVLLLVAVPAGPARAAFPGSNGAIAFDAKAGGAQSYGDIDVHVFEARPDGTGQVAVTNVGLGASLDIVPTFSPDGNRIAFLRCAAVLFGCNSGRVLWVANADGTNARQLVNLGPGGGASWSPDGTKLVFAATDSNDIYGTIDVINADGSNRHPLITRSGNGVGVPAWSPQGDRVVYFDGSGNVGGALSGDPGLYAVTVAGAVGDASRKHLLLADNDSDLTGAGCGGLNQGGESFDWSPDGSRLLFTCTSVRPTGGTYVTYEDVALLTVASGQIAKLTNTAVAAPSTGNEARESQAVWSPDGTQIAYFRDGGIWTATATGANQHRITAFGDSPSWQPCGSATARCGPPPQPPAGGGTGGGTPGGGTPGGGPPAGGGPGSSGSSPSGGSDTTPPAAPGGLKAKAGNRTVTLSWQAVSASDRATYRIYKLVGARRTRVGTVVHGRVSKPRFSVRRLKNKHRYRFAVTAVDAKGNESKRSSSVVATPRAPACVVPRLVGRTLSSATKALKRAHCRLGKVDRPKGVRASRLVVAGTTPGPHARRAHNSRVKVRLERR